MTETFTVLTIVNALLLLANLAIFGMCLKLYTEYFKDASARRRGER